MRNIFGIDLDHNRPGKDKTLYDVMDGQKFRVTGAAGKLAKLHERYAERIPEKHAADHISEAAYQIGRSCMKILRFYPLILLILALIWFQDLNSRPLHTIQILLIPAFVLLAVLLLCLVLGKICVPKTVGRTPGFDSKQLMQDYEKELKKLLAIPDSAERIDIFCFTYQWKSGKAVQRKNRTGRVFTNMEYFAYMKEGKLFLTDGHDLFEIPKAAITSIEHLEEKGNASFPSWNKEQPYTDAAYARYRVKKGVDNYYMPLAAVYQVEVKNRPEPFGFFVAGYDVEALCRVLGRPAPKLPIPKN